MAEQVENRPDRTRRDRTGRTYGTLTVIAYDNGQRKWLCRCECDAEVYRTAKTLNDAERPSCGNEVLHGRKTEITYSAAHMRLSRQRGPANKHRCANCGRTRARQWAYDNNDPDEMTSPEGYRYSADVGHYRPLCSPCHTLADAAERSISRDQLDLFATRNQPAYWNRARHTDSPTKKTNQ